MRVFIVGFDVLIIIWTNKLIAKAILRTASFVYRTFTILWDNCSWCFLKKAKNMARPMMVIAVRVNPIQHVDH